MSQPDCFEIQTTSLRWMFFIVFTVFCTSETSVERISASEFEFSSQRFTVPDGFSVEVAAGPPLVDRPITFDFDEEGRLYVAESSGSNAPVADQLLLKPHRILRLEDSDGDGVFDSRTLFAEGMMLPEGTMWFRGSLYVAAPPSIWKLTDRDGDGIAEDRIEWFSGKTLTGCANDLHGPYRGPDGWIYWCKGAFAEQTYDLPNRPGWKTRASHIFRSKPDGTLLEPVLTGGMDNPVDLVFTDRGDQILSCTFLEHPAGGLRDGLLHAIYGGVYGKDHSVLDGHPRTGDLMPTLAQLGPAASCGLHAYRSQTFGEEYRGNLFSCAFNLRKVVRHTLVPIGASYTSTDSDFLVCDSSDFHPTDCIEDADGSLLVADTGGWYKLCCPTSQFEKPATLGKIYRIRPAPKSTLKTIHDPRGLKIAWQTQSMHQCASLLGDARPVVMDQAIEMLAAAGEKSLVILEQTINEAQPAARLGALWTLVRIDHDRARTLVRACLDDADPSIRYAAAHGAGLHRDRVALASLTKRLADTDRGVARAAAEAIGRLKDEKACRSLLEAVETHTDRALEHSLRYALIEIANAPAIVPFLDSKSALIQASAMIAIDQIDALSTDTESLLDEKRIGDLCNSSDPLLFNTAWWIASRHPQWADALSHRVRPQLERASTSDRPQSDIIIATLAKLVSNPSIVDALAEVIADRSATPPVRLAALKTMSIARPKQTPLSCLEAIASLLREQIQQHSPDLLLSALQTLASLPLEKEQRQTLVAPIMALVDNQEVSSDAMLAGLSLLAEFRPPLSEAIVQRLLDVLEESSMPLKRSNATSILADSPLPEGTLEMLADRIDTLGPLEITNLLPAITKSGFNTLARAITSLERLDDLSGIRGDALENAVVSLPEELRDRGQALLERAAASTQQQRKRLIQIAASLPPGDRIRGYAVFSGNKSGCTTCHAMAYIGGRFGPDLSRIGQIRSSADLLESIVLPSLSFVRSYESVIVVTSSGKVFNGILRDQTNDAVTLQTGPSTTETLLRESIESIAPSQTSIMPKGYDVLLSPQELSDLIAFLQHAR